jgi:hypothetical protein
MSYLIFSRSIARLSVVGGFCMALGVALAMSNASQAAAMLEIADFSKPGEKKIVTLDEDAPKLFNIEFFSGWSHCEVAAGINLSTKQSHAWMRCFGLDETQVALICQGNERQTVVLGHKDDNPKRGSLSLVCRSD